MVEVATYADESQFQPGHSVMKCGFYALCQNHFAGQPGHAPGGSGADIMRQADIIYVQYDGADVSSNPRGMSMQQEYDVLKQLGNHWQNLYPDSLPNISQNDLKVLIREWIKLGYPVVIALDEATVHDMELKANPYSWNPQPGQYTHIVTVTGLQDNGIDFLCRDTASIAPNGVRPGPRHYASTPMDLVSATLFIPNWKDRPAGPEPGQQPSPPPPPVPTPTPPPTDWKKEISDAVVVIQNALTHL